MDINSIRIISIKKIVTIMISMRVKDTGLIIIIESRLTNA